MKKKFRATNPPSGSLIKEAPSEIGSTNDSRLVFSFHHHGKELCITDCQMRQQAAFAKHLYTLSQLTWNELLLADHKGIGHERIRRTGLKKSIPKTIKGDVEYFLSFRFDSGNGRIIGYRANALFHIVWIDVSPFQAYDHS